MDRKTPFCQGASSSKTDAIPVRIPASYFLDTDNLILPLHGSKKAQSSQLNIEREEHGWKIDTTRLQDLVQNYSHQNIGEKHRQINGTEQGPGTVPP